MQMPMMVSSLRHALMLLEPVVDRKSSIKAYAYVRLGDGVAVAAGRGVVVAVEMPEARHDGNACLLPHGLALDFLRYVPGSSSVGVVAKDSRVILMAKAAQVSLQSLKPEEFPPLPEFQPELTGVVDGDELVKTLVAVAPYAAVKETRPVLTAVCLTLGEAMEAAAADGFRLAVRTLRSGFPGGDGRRVLVPRETVGVLAQMWKLAPPPPEQGEGKSVAELVVSRRPMELQVTGKVLRVHFGDVTAWCQLVEGNFPNYQQLIPTGHKSRLTLVTDELVRAAKTVQGMARDGSGIVRLRYEPERLTVSAVAAETGEVETTAPIQLEGEAGHIALSSGNLLDYLKGREGVLVVELNSPSNPAVFIHRGERVVVMPMHVQWGDAPKEQPREGAAETPSAPAPAGDEPDEEMDDETTRMEEPTSGDSAAPQPETEAPKAPRRGRKRKAPTDPAP